MGFAKYHEDNYEMFLDRIEEHERKEVTIKTTTTTSVSVSVSTVEKSVKTEKTKVKTGKWLRCKDCGETFFFPEESQKLFKEKRWEDPLRCSVCFSRNPRKYYYQRSY